VKTGTILLVGLGFLALAGAYMVLKGNGAAGVGYMPGGLSQQAPQANAWSLASALAGPAMGFLTNTENLIASAVETSNREDVATASDAGNFDGGESSGF